MKFLFECNDLEEGWYDPPEYDDPTELDDEEETIYYDFDTEIMISENGHNIDLLDKTFGDNPDNKNGEWYSEEYHDVCLAYGDDIVDSVFDLIENDLPEEDGKYHISGEAELHYNIIGLMESPKTNFWHDDEYDEYGYDGGELITDYVEVEYLNKKSSVKNLKIDKIQ